MIEKIDYHRLKQTNSNIFTGINILTFLTKVLWCVKYILLNKFSRIGQQVYDVLDCNRSLSANAFDSITCRHSLGLTFSSDVEIILAFEFPPEALEYLNITWNANYFIAIQIVQVTFIFIFFLISLLLQLFWMSRMPQSGQPYWDVTVRASL